MALRVGGLLKALERGLGRPKGSAPNPMFAQYVQGLEQRAAAASAADADALASVVEDWENCVASVDRYKVGSAAWLRLSPAARPYQARVMCACAGRRCLVPGDR
jgi:hypothetical protein